MVRGERVVVDVKDWLGVWRVGYDARVDGARCAGTGRWSVWSRAWPSMKPTSPTTSPGWMSTLIRSSTRATPWSVTKSTARSRTDRSSLGMALPGPPDPGVQDVAEPVAEQVEPHDGQEDGQPRRGRVPPGL